MDVEENVGGVVVGGVGEGVLNMESVWASMVLRVVSNGYAEVQENEKVVACPSKLKHLWTNRNKSNEPFSGDYNIEFTEMKDKRRLKRS